jgi:hypothetical protein
MKYKFICETDWIDQPSSRVEHTIEADELSPIVKEFELFLLGNGFHPDNVKNYIITE